MSEPISDEDQEQYAFKVTRRLFWYTCIGTIAFSVVMVILSGLFS